MTRTALTEYNDTFEMAPETAGGFSPVKARCFYCDELQSCAPLAPGRDEVHIWYVPADDSRIAAQSGILSDDEKKRAQRYRHNGTRTCYQVGHTALRLLLARYLNVSAEELSFVYGTHGKPSLANLNGIHFNISHSGSWIALAFSAHAPVGIDIEHARETRKKEQIVRRFFHPQETEIYRTLSETERQLFFYEHWTAREAALKALGIGLTVEINTFLIQKDKAHGTFSVTDGPAGSERLHLTGIECPDGYVGCVAYE